MLGSSQQGCKGDLGVSVRKVASSQHKPARIWSVCVQETSQCKTWSGQGGAAEGSLQSAADVEVSTSKDADSKEEMVSIQEVNVPRSKGNEFVLRHITKFQDIVRDLNSPALAGPRTAGVAAY